MSSAFLTRRDKRHLVLWLLAGIVGLAFYLVTYDRAFPVASVNIELSRSEIVRIGEDFLVAEGHDISDYKTAMTFGSSGVTSQFLEKELGAHEANRVMSDELDAWKWSIRWFRPSQEEEFLVTITPGGRVTGFRWRVPENLAFETGSMEDAEVLGEGFLDRFGSEPTAMFHLQESQEQERPNRTDYRLEWEHNDVDYKGAKLRARVVVYGDRVGAFTQYLYVPEAWLESEAKKNQQRSLLSSIALWGNEGLSLCAFIVFLLLIRRGKLRMGFALLLTGMLAVLAILDFGNSLDLSWMGYDTKATVGAFFGAKFLGLCINLMSDMFIVLIVGCAGDALAREVFPSRPPLNEFMRRNYWTSKPIFMATAVGGALAFIHAAYVSGFYLVGGEVGVWSPMHTPYLNTLSTPMPWLYPLTVGFTAALKEEMVYRLFAVSLLLRYTKRTWLAVGLPAIVWGFMHSNYPQDPAFIRGLELTIVGIVFGIVFIRYGILTSFVSHYAYNALMSSMVMLRSDDAYYVSSGVIVVALMLLPAMPGALRIVRRKPLTVWESSGDEQDYQFPQHRPAERVVFRTIPFIPALRRRYIVLSATAVVSVLVMAAFSSRLPERDDYVVVEVNRVEAQSIALEYLREQGVRVDEFQAVTTFVADFSRLEFEYLSETIGGENVANFYETYLPHEAAWWTHVFRPLERTSHIASVTPGGEVYRWRTILPEDAPGAQLTPEEAQALAESYLVDVINFQSEDYELVGESSVELEARNEHQFVWELRDDSVGSEVLRVSVPVQGDMVRGYYPFVHIPDEWRRERNSSTGWDILAMAIAAIVSLSVVVYVGGIFTSLFVQHELNWRLGIFSGVCAGGLLLIGELNEASTFWASYNPIINPGVFRLDRVLSAGTKVLGSALLVFLAVPVAEGFLRTTSTSSRPPLAWLGSRVQKRLGMRGRAYSPMPWRSVWGEAIVLGTLLFPILLSLGALLVPMPGQAPPLLFRIFLTDSPITPPSLNIPSVSTSVFPLLEGAFNFVAAVFVLFLLSGVVAGVYRTLIRNWRRALALATVLSFALGFYKPDGLGDYAVQVVSALMILGCWSLPIILLRWSCGTNPIAYLMTFVMTILFPLGAGFANQAYLPSLVPAGWAIIAVWCAVAAVGLYWLVSGSRAASTSRDVPYSRDREV